MAALTAKKVVVRRFEREPLQGYVSIPAYIQAAGVELMSPAGEVSILPYAEIRSVAFVRDFEDVGDGHGSRFFNARPKIEGLWVRLRFRDGEQMEGVIPNDLLHLEWQGFTLAPPGRQGHEQRLFVPRAALTEFHVLGVVGIPAGSRKGKPAPKDQGSLFE